ncbi:DUF805 domain-containing protein [Sinomonas humi]|uniref:DUF805 domain-containing protein n=1 Tax=Sinomonas humi TaxID=1338436 RepID=UPI000689D7FC|nr:DUF805 domain-containing protein [Sinomonas humi]
MAMQEQQRGQEQSLDLPLYGATFREAFRRFWLKDFTFTGRASRSEYWLVYRLGAIVSILSYALDYAVTALKDPVIGYSVLVLMLTVAVVCMVPGLALCVRRLHDANFSGWWLLLGLVPFVGSMALLVMFTRRTNPLGVRFDVVRARPTAPPIPLAPGLAGPPPVDGGGSLPRPTAHAAPAQGARSESGRSGARWALAGLGALILVVVLAVAASSLLGSVGQAAPAQSAQEQATPEANPYSLPVDPREDALRAQLKADPSWEQYSDGLFIKWEPGKSACQGVGAHGCATALLENISMVPCEGGTIEMSLMSNGKRVWSSSAKLPELSQGLPTEIGVPFDPSLQGDSVNLDWIDCS